MYTVSNKQFDSFKVLLSFGAIPYGVESDIPEFKSVLEKTKKVYYWRVDFSK